MRNEWSELGADIKAGAWSEKVENEWSELGATKGKMAGVLSANDGWSSERFLKMAWSLERRPQKGLERGAPKFPFLVGAPKFSKTCRSISKTKTKKGGYSSVWRAENIC